VSCKLTALTIRKYGEEVTRLELTAERAEELAAEVNALNEAASLPRRASISTTSPGSSRWL